MADVTCEQCKHRIQKDFADMQAVGWCRKYRRALWYDERRHRLIRRPTCVRENGGVPKEASADA